MYYVFNSTDRLAPIIKHTTLSSARNEAERLAKIYKGKTFEVLSIEGDCRVEPQHFKTGDVVTKANNFCGTEFTVLGFDPVNRLYAVQSHKDKTIGRAREDDLLSVPPF